MGSRNTKLCFAVIILLVLSAAVTGCSRQDFSEKIVATVNDYKMTVGDFNYESKEIMQTGKLIGDIPITKEDILDSLIIKEVLLQEAQRQGLDKDKSFMKTIELYWEQTLLKNLLAKKSKQITDTVRVYDDEIIAYYEKMRDEIKAKVYVFDNEKTARKMLNYKDDIDAHLLEKEEDRLHLSYTVPSKWYSLSKEKSLLEYSVFNIDKQKYKEIVELSDRWALIVIEDRRATDILPLAVLKSDIAKSISMQKERDLLNEWIDSLRKEARVRIDDKVLDELP
ncbi:MAG: SurA N-terminal domain-containing protein [Candidatus Omnitrophica bacterium]|nr:SurA N-terminal domain-containing protein [Candidatus Omnitrophota bacterium]